MSFNQQLMNYAIIKVLHQFSRDDGKYSRWCWKSSQWSK